MTPGTKIGLSIAGGLLIALLITVFSIYGYTVGVKNTSVRMEESLSQEYRNNQNVLSTFVSTFYKTTDITRLKTSDKFNQDINSAVQDRYGEDGVVKDGGTFSAVVEACPDAASAIYNDIVIQVQAERESFRASQTKLFDKVRVYNTWRLEGFLRSIAIASVLHSGATVEEAFESSRMEPLIYS